MRAVLQRVSQASVAVDGDVVGAIGRGWLVLLGIGQTDGEEDIDYIVQKTVNLRAFPDSDGKLNLSVLDIAGEVLVVSQFTLYGDCRKGRRPSFSDSSPPDKARELYERVVSALRGSGITVATGQFQAMMNVRLENEGPVTLLVDSKKLF